MISQQRGQKSGSYIRRSTNLFDNEWKFLTAIKEGSRVESFPKLRPGHQKVRSVLNGKDDNSFNVVLSKISNASVNEASITGLYEEYYSLVNQAADSLDNNSDALLHRSSSTRRYRTLQKGKEDVKASGLDGNLKRLLLKIDQEKKAIAELDVQRLQHNIKSKGKPIIEITEDNRERMRTPHKYDLGSLKISPIVVNLRGILDQNVDEVDNEKGEPFLQENLDMGLQLKKLTKTTDNAYSIVDQSKLTSSIYDARRLQIKTPSYYQRRFNSFSKDFAPDREKNIRRKVDDKPERLIYPTIDTKSQSNYQNIIERTAKDRRELIDKVKQSIFKTQKNKKSLISLLKSDY